MIQFLRNLPAGVSPSSMKKYGTKTLEPSTFTFYQALRDMEGDQRGVNFKTILPYIEEKGIVVFQPFPIERVRFFPDFCLFVSTSMKAKYLEYGRFIGIDFTYNLIRQKPYVSEEEDEAERKKRPKQWITGIISGLDSARRLLIYGIAFCHS